MTVATLTLYEQETIINYNREEPDASCFTHDPALIRRLDALARDGTGITVARQGDGWKEYRFPKQWVKIRKPRELSEETRAKLAARAAVLHTQKDKKQEDESC